MTNLKDYTASALMGIHHMGVRAGDHSTALHNLFMHAADLAIAARPPRMLTYHPNPKRTRQMTTVRDIHGDIVKVYDEDGDGDYDACDCCGKVFDITYLDSNNECDDCVDDELTALDGGELPLDTPSLDTMFHDHKMEC
jgi:hypothetical protein